ncbi:hypothetical protein VaNZ11_011145 [Volvox africanus]|uniref:Uncharacterized protein n=1 Tax=Volvox africanus TaxID=51714 RepID=A0ABQ5SDH0_9CHLO|nr:hypothetical protein VaNZ11_011145 [Volvox africanus]
MLFRKGLTPALLAPCRVNFRGSEFESLDELIEHTMGEEKKLKEITPIKTVLNDSFAARTPRPNRNCNQKRPGDGWTSVVKKPRIQGGDGAGPSEGRGRCV